MTKDADELETHHHYGFRSPLKRLSRRISSKLEMQQVRREEKAEYERENMSRCAYARIYVCAAADRESVCM